MAARVLYSALVHLHFGWASCWGGATASFIAIRDRDFVGEDPVLAAALKRRMSRSQPPPELLVDDEPKRSQNPVGLTPSPHPYRRAGGAHAVNHTWDKIAYHDLIEANDVKKTVVGHLGDQPNFQEYPRDWNNTHLYAMQLKVAEQAIYGMQMRLQDLDAIMKPYTQNQLMRMAYTMKRLDIWMREMKDFYDFSHKAHDPEKVEYHKYHPHRWRDKWAYPASHDNPWWFPNWRHIMYYQAMLRRYIDILYCVEYLRKAHAEETQKFAAFNADRKKRLESMLSQLSQAGSPGA